MMTQFDRPESRLTVELVTVRKNIAVAGWAQGDVGGRALLRRFGRDWRVIQCSGDTLKEAKLFQQFGLDAEEAEGLVEAIVDAETKLDPALVAKFSTFDGIVMMKDGYHPPVGGHRHVGKKKS